MSTLANLTEVLFRLDFDPDTAVYHYRGQTLSRLQCRTYILSQASQLARLLKPGDRVVLALNDSPSLACLFLACIAVGAIPAVINPKSREQALADIAADCQASLVVREADAPSLSGPLAPLTLRAAAGRPLLDDFSLDALVGPADLDWSAFHRQDPAAACFLQYTSGSTGAPKGVMHSLRNTLGFCRAFATELLALQAGDRLYSIPKMLRGPGLSPGYWRASEEQQARFAGGWYRTGDLFERDESGAYRHCGREDDLFKVNGRWVVPTQVEQAICRHLPEVSEAVLVPTCRLHDGLRPTLFVTLATPLDDNQILLAQRIDQHLAEQIPSHMLPSQLHVLPALPRNDNGKLARAELRHLADTLYHDNLPEERAC